MCLLPTCLCVWGLCVCLPTCPCVCLPTCLCVYLSNHQPRHCTVQARCCRRLTSRPSRRPLCAGAARTWTSCTSPAPGSTWRTRSSARSNPWQAPSSRSPEPVQRAARLTCTRAELACCHAWAPGCRKPVLWLLCVCVLFVCFWFKIKTHKRFKRTLFIMTKHNQQIFGLIPFIKLQNDT